MKLDNETQRDALLKMIDAAGIAGKDAEFIVELKRAVREAELEENEHVEQNVK